MNNNRPDPYIERDLEKKLEKYLDDPEILAVIGPRQSGKTTLLQHIQSNLEKANFTTFEDMKTLELFEEDIDGFIEQNVEGYNYLFIDEVQYSEKAGKNLKYIYDTKDIKILVTGSSSTELSFRGLKHLTGRVLVFHLYPLSFREYLRFKDNRLYSSIEKKKPSEPIIKEILPYFKDFVLYGGYPRIALEDDDSKKEKILEDIYNIFMLREIQETLGIKDRVKLSKLLRTLSLQIGNLVNYNKLSDATGYTYSKLKSKLNILQETFICSEVDPFYTNKKKEIVKNPKIFFFDNGLRNSVIGNFSKERSDMGELYENFVFTELVKEGFEPRFWRSKDKAEVDFVIERDGEVVPIEVKNTLHKERLTKSFTSFLRSYEPERGYFLSKDLMGEKGFKDTDVEYFPAFYLHWVLDRF